MPELPEAETIAAGLRRRVVGRTIAQVRVVHADVLRTDPTDFRGCVRRRTVDGVERRGKNVLLHLGAPGGEPADAARVMVVNLGMTGRLLPWEEGRGAGSVGATHPALHFRFAGGGGLIYDDVRRFGAVECLEPEAWAERSRALGPEPLAADFQAGELAETLARSRSPVRSWLLDQRRIAGVGNIYANEALHVAGIHPRRPASSLDRDEAIALHRALRRVLEAAVRAGGTTIRDYRDAEGRSGSYARRLAVYGREGAACPRCGGTVERIVFGNRSAFVCTTCQPERPRP